MKAHDIKYASELSLKILGGIRMAVKRLIEEEAQKNGELVISRHDKVVHIKASELLKDLDS